MQRKQMVYRYDTWFTGETFEQIGISTIVDGLSKKE